MGIWYRTGTASVANGSPTVTGVGTTWLVFARQGDMMTFDNGGKWYEILSVNSNNSITLASNFAEATIPAPGVSYAINPSSYRHQIPSDILEQLRQVLAGQTDLFETTGQPPADLGAENSVAIDFASFDLFYRDATSWVGPVPLVFADAHRFNFATATAMADPGSGFLRFNSATIASVTAIAIDSVAASPGAPNIEAVIREWDDSTNLPHRGILTIRNRVNPAAFAIFRVSGASVENAGWTQLTVTHLASVGPFAANNPLAVSFVRTGNAGDVLGPASAVDLRIPVFSGTSGKILVDSGKTISDVVNDALAAVRGGVSAALDTLSEIAADLATRVSKAGDTMTGALTLDHALFQTRSITPAALTADVNNYAPTDFATCSRLNISGDAAWRIVTGLAGGASGRRVQICNVGSHPIILSGENALSTAANRFSFGGVSLVLLPGEICELLYDGTASRWREISNQSGIRKARRLSADTINNNAAANTLADLPGLSFWMEVNRTYEFRIKVPYSAAATTTGSRWTVNGPASPTLVAFESNYTLTATTQTTNYGSAYQAPAAANATSLATGNLAVIDGVVRNGATAGLLQAQFASEGASSAITALAAGGVIEWREVA